MSVLDSFDSVDFKAPIGKANDMRTSSYIGHRYLNTKSLDDTVRLELPPQKTFADDPVLQTQRVSETRAQFDWKFPEPDEVRNPKMDYNMSYLKDYTDVRIKFVPRPIAPAVSVTHATYKGQPLVRREKPKMPPVPTAVKPTSVMIFDPLKASNVKALDPCLSTTRRDYVAYAPEVAAAAQDITTYYSWQKKYTALKPVMREPQLCNSAASKDCPKRPVSYHSQVAPVPHIGMTTEVRENYTKPHKKNVSGKASRLIQPDLYHQETMSPNDTEYNIIGSGHRVQKYV